MKKYYLMNKNNVVATFEQQPTSELTDDIRLNMVTQSGNLPYGFRNINSWIENRKASKHSEHLRLIMKKLGCERNEGFINLTHGASINDTFWVKSEMDRAKWENVSLYNNEFSETISELALHGIGLNSIKFSTTIPELTCDGAFRKCFRKEREIGEFGSDIFIYKTGIEHGKNYEPYSEVLASEIARFLTDKSVKYDISNLHGDIVTKCNIFTSEDVGFVSYAKLFNETHESDLQTLMEFYSQIGCEQELREMLVIDSLCFNTDRHQGNYGVLINNNTQEIIGMPPVFDLNLALLPYKDIESIDTVGDSLYKISPRIGDDFTRLGQMVINDSIRDKLTCFADFSFAFRGDDIFPEERVRVIERMVRKQAEALLSKEKLFVYDVFHSDEAQRAKEQQEAMQKAKNRLLEYASIMDEEKHNECFADVLLSIGNTEYFIEKDSYIFSIDFLSGTLKFEQNMNAFPLSKLKEMDKGLYNAIRIAKSCLKEYAKGKQMKEFQSLYEGEDKG